MAEKKIIKKPRAAKDLKPSDVRQTWAEGRRKVGPAKDVEPGSLREKAAKGRVTKKPPSGVLTSERRFSDIKKSRGPFGTLAVRKENLPAVQKEPSREIVKRGEGAVKKYEGPKSNVPAKRDAGGRMISGSGIGGTVARGLYRTIGGPAVMLVSMTEPAGAGSDKPSGPLMKASKWGVVKTVNPYKGQSPAAGKGDRGVSKASTATPKVDSAAPKPQSFKDKMQGRNWNGGAKPAPKAERKVEGKKPEKRKVGFKGNWVGAAPTAMQARGGVRRTKAENLRRLFREK